MKHFYFALISFFFLSCKDDNDCCINSFKGKLVKKGICMNYVILGNIFFKLYTEFLFI